jgi:hypothetical protein
MCDEIVEVCATASAGVCNDSKVLVGVQANGAGHGRVELVALLGVGGKRESCIWESLQDCCRGGIRTVKGRGLL